MRDIFYVELSKRGKEIREMKQSALAEEITEKNHGLLEIIDEIAHLSHIGRKEGLLRNLSSRERRSI